MLYIPSPILLIVLGALLIGFLLNRRHAIVTHVVSTIAASMRLNLPLADALDQAGGGHNDRRSVLLRRIAYRLREGGPLSDALRSAYPRLPGWIGGMVVAGERIGQLPAVFQALQGELIRQGRRRFHPKAVHPLYALLVIFVATIILSGLSVFIFPKLMAIFESFNSDMPQITLTVANLMDEMSPFFWAFSLALPLAVPVAIYLLFRPREPQAPRLLSWVGDFIKWHLPGVGWYEMMRGQSQAAGMLQLSLSAGQTVDAALANLSAMDLNLFYRRRLRKWHRLVVGGEAPSRAARKCRVGRMLAMAFEESNGPNVPEVLGMTQRLSQSHAEYAATLYWRIASPFIVMLLACMVGIVAYAVFLPITHLHQSVMKGIIP